MILDEVLNENREFTKEEMRAFFTEGFLYALEMQKEGKKAQSIEELSNALTDAAIKKIDEVSGAVIAAGAYAATMGGLIAINHIMEKKMKKEAKEIIEELLKESKYSKIKKDITTNFEMREDYSAEYKDHGFAKMMIPVVVYSLKCKNSDLNNNKKLIKNIIEEANKTFHGRSFKLHPSSYSKSGETWLLITIIANQDAKYDPNKI